MSITNILYEPSDPLDPVAPPMLGNSRDGLLNLTQHFMNTQRDVLTTAFEHANPEDLHVIFGDMAMYLAGNTVPADATPFERANAVNEAIRHIYKQPELSRAIAHVALETPGAESSNNATQDEASQEPELTRKQRKAYEALKKDASKDGSIAHSQFEPGQFVLLEYKPTSGNRDGTVELLLETREPGAVTVSSTVYSTVEKAKQYNPFKGYSEPEEIGYGRQGLHKWPVREVFKLSNVRDTAQYGAIKANQKWSQYETVADDATLVTLQGQDVTLGTMIQGEPMKLGHSFYAADKVSADTVEQSNFLSDYPRSATYDPQLNLAQAYFNGDKRYPIFESR